MKKTILVSALVLASLLDARALEAYLKEPKKAEIINLIGRDYTVSKELPEEILGVYTYEGQGLEPEIEIKSDITGFFQPHGLKGFPLRFASTWTKKTRRAARSAPSNANARRSLSKYGEGGSVNNKAGSYDLLDDTMLKDEGIAMILGEQIRRLN